MNEEWVRWDIPGEMKLDYYVDAIEDNFDCFRIILSEEDNREKGLVVTFKDSVWAYRSAEEGFNQKRLLYLKDKYGSDFYYKNSFFKVENSSYLSWLHEESFGIYENAELVHYCIIAVDFIVDIIDDEEPKITFFEK